MLGSCDLVAFVPTTNPAAAKAFYEGTLGLRLISEDPFALVFDANGTPLRVTTVESAPQLSFTVLGWTVPDITAAVHELVADGVVFERFEGVEQDDDGVWTVPGGGARVAWFKDPDANILSVTQAPG
jgi:catechol 2,3-dioxygenase-like lactoylglutathione lyase family enzyme